MRSYIDTRTVEKGIPCKKVALTAVLHIGLCLAGVDGFDDRVNQPRRTRAAGSFQTGEKFHLTSLPSQTRISQRLRLVHGDSACLQGEFPSVFGCKSIPTRLRNIAMELGTRHLIERFSPIQWKQIHDPGAKFGRRLGPIHVESPETSI